MLGLVYLLALGATWAGSDGTITVAGLSVFAWCALLAFSLQWLAFIPAYLKQTEVYYDLTGSLTFISTVMLALLLSQNLDSRSILLASCIILWAARLGSFLFRRIRQDGADSRFERIKPDPRRFFLTWSLQGLWVVLTAGCAWAAMTSERSVALSLIELLGFALWLAGWLLEVVADRQKRFFRTTYGSEGFINSGVWRFCRHPNYLGEIILWFGIALIALPALQGWQHVSLISPLFVAVLLTRVSGIPLLERKADRKWGGQADYEAYKRSTPTLIPRWP
ncbi:MAG: DUF1295 domain-containing protein [Pseudomonadota bacterium]